MEDLDFACFLRSDDGNESDYEQPLFHKQAAHFLPEQTLARAVESMQPKSNVKSDIYQDVALSSE